MSTQKRGQLTKRVKVYALSFLGRQIDVTELRLIPYLQYLAVNKANIDPNRISQEERRVFINLKKDGYLSGGMTSPILPSKPFWNFMSEIVYLAYIDLD